MSEKTIICLVCGNIVHLVKHNNRCSCGVNYKVLKESESSE